MRCYALLVWIAACAAPLWAQQQHEHLSVRLAVVPQTDNGTGLITVRIWNTGHDTVNMPPTHFACGADLTPASGESLGARVQLSVRVDTGTLRKANAPLTMDSCMVDPESPAATWRHIAPGQYTELKAMVRPGLLTVPGAKYAVRADYLGPKLAREDKAVIKAGGIVIPGGSYGSNVVAYEVAEDGASIQLRPH